MTSRSQDLKNPITNLHSELEELQVARAATKSQHLKKVFGASTSVIDCLPPEIMLQIFEAYDELWQPMVWPPPIEIMARVKPVIHTCSLWRALALKCPSFWSVICTDWPEDFLDWMLAMGGDAPLKIPRPYRSVSLSRSLKDNIWRLRQLGSELKSVERQWFAPIFDTMVADPAQCNLETLAIISDDFHLNNRDDAMLPDLLRACRPTLRHLCMDRINVSKDCLRSLASLRTLSLSDAPLGTTTIGELLYAISISCPCIDTLVILSDLEDTSFVSARMNQKPHFPCLKRFWISLELGIMQTAMEALDLPPDCCLRLSETESHFSAATFDSFHAVMLPILQDRGRICHAAYLNLEWEASVRFIADDASQDIEVPDRTIDNFALTPHWPSIHLGFILPDSYDEAELYKRAIQSFVRTAAANCALEFLHVSARGLTTGNSIWPCVAAFDGLERLLVDEHKGGFDADRLMRGVLEPLNGGSAGAELLAPKLRVLEISVRLSPAAADPHSWHESATVKDFVRRRQECGAPLDRMQLIDPDVKDRILCDLLSPRNN